MKRLLIAFVVVTVVGGMFANMSTGRQFEVAVKRPADSNKYIPTAEQLRESYQRANQRNFGRGRVYKDQVSAHWFGGNARFWYRNELSAGKKEFILVDAEAGTRQAAFDHAKLAVALSKSAGKEYSADKLPFDSIEYADDSKSVRFTVGDTAWSCNLSSYECSKSDKSPKADDNPNGEPGASATGGSPTEDEPSPWADELSPSQQQGGTRPQQRPQPDRPERSPDGAWTAFVKDFNVWLRDRDGKELQLSKDGSPTNGYGNLSWARDSQNLVAWRSEPGDDKEVYLVQSSPPGGGRAKLQSRPYALPGDRYPTYELNLFDAATQKQTKPEVERIDLGRPRLRWM